MHLKAENNLIFENYINSLLIERSIGIRLQQIIDAGKDVVVNTNINPPVVVFNTNNSGSSPNDSIMTGAVHETIKELIAGPEISGEGDQSLNNLTRAFREPQMWKRVINVSQIPPNAVIVNHKGQIVTSYYDIN